MWTRHKEFAAPVPMKTWLVDGKPQMRTFSVVIGGAGRDPSEVRHVPDLRPGERFVELVGDHSYIVTEADERDVIQPMQLDRVVYHCPLCGVDKMYFGCFCNHA